MKTYIFTIVIFLNNIVGYSQWQQLDPWEQTGGPFGGSVTCLYNNNDTVYAVVNNAIFYTTENGGDWHSVNNVPLANKYIKCVTADTDSNIYAASYGSVFHSHNLGSTWSKVDILNGGNGQDFTAIASKENLVFAGSTFGLYRSIDYGHNWQLLYNAIIKSIKRYGNEIYVVDNNVKKSTDNGNSWVQIFNDGGCHSFEKKDSVLYVGVGSGFAVSEDNGNTWTYKNAGLPTAAWPLPVINSIVIKGSEIFIGSANYGVFKSSDSLTGWVPVNNGLTDLEIKALILCDTTLIAGTNSGIFLSNDNGISWTISNACFTNLNVKSFCANGIKLFTGTTNGVFLTTDFGNSWTEINNGLTNHSVFSMTTFDTTIFVGTSNGKVFSTNNYGNSWTLANNGLPNRTIYSLSNNTNTLFAGTDTSGFYKTGFSPISWQSSNNGLPANHGIITMTVRGDTIIAGTRTDGVFRSYDNGNNWESINNGLSSTFSITIDKNENDVFLSTLSGSYYSSDNGTIWIPTFESIAQSSVTKFKIIPPFVFAGTALNGIFVSSDMGLNWIQINDSLPGYTINDIEKVGKYLFIGTNGGVFKRPLSIVTKQGNFLASNSSSGNQWYSESGGLIPGAINQNFEPTTSGRYYNILTLDSLDSPPSNIVDFTIGIKNNSHSECYSFSYNSIKKSVDIRFEENNNDNSISVYNMLGKKIINRNSLPRWTEIDLQNLLAGTYFVKISCKEKSAVRKIIIY